MKKILLLISSLATITSTTNIAIACSYGVSFTGKPQDPTEDTNDPSNEGTQEDTQKTKLTEELLAQHFESLSLSYSGISTIPSGANSGESTTDLTARWKIQYPMNEIAASCFYQDLNENFNYEGYGFLVWFTGFTSDTKTIVYDQEMIANINVNYISPTVDNIANNSVYTFQLKVTLTAQYEGQEYLEKTVNSVLNESNYADNTGGVNTTRNRNLPMVHTYWPGNPLLNLTTDELEDINNAATTRYNSLMPGVSFEELQAEVTNVQLLSETVSEVEYPYASVTFKIWLVENPEISMEANFFDPVSYK